MTAYSDIKAAPSVLRIETLRPQDLTAEDARLWRSFLARRPELSGPYFDIRYVRAAASAVPDAGVARFYDEDRVVGYFPYQIRSGALQPFGAPLSDYHGVIAAPGCDMPFGELLAADRGATRPSVVLLRSADRLTSDEQAALLAANLSAVADELEAGAIVTIARGRMRIRSLPILPAD